ncbi:MAG: tyrosine-type recombinase/integrase [Candidatus Coproplasma sp.]
MNEQRIITLASRLVTAGITQNSEEVAKISSELAAELRNSESADIKNACTNEKNYSGLLKFTSQEISKMPKEFSKYFRAEGLTVHYRKRCRGKDGKHFSYEVRFRRNGYNISVSGKTIEEIKERFIIALHEIEENGAVLNVPKSFNKFAVYYFENFYKRKVKDSTYVGNMYKYNKHVKPVFAELPLIRVTPKQCQDLLDNLTAKGMGKTADEVYSILNGIFKAAIKHNLIRYNPLDLITHNQHERKHGSALTKSEESSLLSAMDGTKYQTLFAVALYTGLRPNEYKTAKIDGDFIVAVNSKQKNGKTAYKKIPISPMLRPYLDGVTTLKFPTEFYMRDKMKAVLPNHILYDLRTTFNSRCVECGVSDVARKLFMGHSLGTLDNAYTQVSDDYLLIEGAKIKYDLPPILPQN